MSLLVGAAFTECYTGCSVTHASNVLVSSSPAQDNRTSCHYNTYSDKLRQGDSNGLNWFLLAGAQCSMSEHICSDVAVFRSDHQEPNIVSGWHSIQVPSCDTSNAVVKQLDDHAIVDLFEQSIISAQSC